MRVLSTGEKIKNLRKGIGLKQEDIVSDEITRSLISMVENNKRNLTYKTAKVIAGELNKYYVNLGKEITPDLLLESEVEQAQRIIRERLDEMQQLLNNPVPGNEFQVEESFEKLMKFAEEWKLDEMVAVLHEAKGKYYYKTYQYNEALAEFFSSLEYYLQKIKYNKVAYLYNLIGSCYYQLDLFDQALVYYDRVYDITLIRDIEDKNKLRDISLKNKISCYRRLNRYDRVVEFVDIFKKNSQKEDRRLYEVLLIEATNFQDIGNYSKAQKIYDSLIKKGNLVPSGTMLLVYENYAELYQLQNQYEKSLECIQLAYQYIDEEKPNYTAYLFLNEARLYHKMGKVNEATSIIEKGLILSEKVNKVDVLFDLLMLKYQIYLDEAAYLEAELELKNAEKIIIENKINDRLRDVFLRYIELYCKNNQLEKCSLYIRKAKELGKPN